MNDTQALVTPDMLKWAREYAASPEAEAWVERILGSKSIADIEKGEPITLDELRKIANAYEIPLAFFYLPSPPPENIPVLKVVHPGHPHVPAAYINDLDDLHDVVISLIGDEDVWQEFAPGSIIITIEVTEMPFKEFRELPALDDIL